MVKKRKIMTGIGALIVALILALGSVAFTACGKGEETPPETNTGKDGLISFEVYMQPSRTEYYIGESFDPSGMVLKAGYDDGTVKNVLYSDCTYSADPLGEGDTYVDIEYNGLSVRIDITVTARPEISDDPGTPVLQKIRLESGPDKTSYVRGEVFNPTGMVIKAVYDNGFEMTVPVSEAQYPQDPLTENDSSVTIRYGGFETTVDIRVSKYIIDIPDGESKAYRGEAETTDLTTMEITESWAEGKSLTESNANASGGIMVANISAAQGYLEYYINSAGEYAATLIGYYLWGNPDTVELDKAFAVKWNNENYNTRASVVGSDGGMGWNDVQRVNMGTVYLKEGENVLRFDRGSGACPNFDCFELYVNDPAGITDADYDTDVSGDAGRWTIEAEDCAVAGTPANDEGKEFTESNSAGKTYLANLGTVGNTITIKVKSDEAKEVDFIASTAFGHVNYDSVDFDAAFSATLNAEPITLTGTILKTDWTTTFAEMKAVTLSLKEGVNTLVLTVKSALVPNIDYFAFETPDVPIDPEDYDIDVSGDAGRWTIEAEDCAVEGTPANSADSFFGEGGGTYISCFGTVGNTITVKVLSDAEKTVNVLMATGYGKGDILAADAAFDVTQNGAPVSCEGNEITSSGWTTFVETSICEVTLDIGVNTLVFEAAGAKVPNIDYIVFTAVSG